MGGSEPGSAMGVQAREQIVREVRMTSYPGGVGCGNILNVKNSIATTVTLGRLQWAEYCSLSGRINYLETCEPGCIDQSI